MGTVVKERENAISSKGSKEIVTLAETLTYGTSRFIESSLCMLFRAHKLIWSADCLKQIVEEIQRFNLQWGGDQAKTVFRISGNQVCGLESVRPM